MPVRVIRLWRPQLLGEFLKPSHQRARPTQHRGSPPIGAGMLRRRPVVGTVEDGLPGLDELAEASAPAGPVSLGDAPGRLWWFWRHS